MLSFKTAGRTRINGMEHDSHGGVQLFALLLASFLVIDSSYSTEHFLIADRLRINLNRRKTYVLHFVSILVQYHYFFMFFFSKKKEN